MPDNTAIRQSRRPDALVCGRAFLLPVDPNSGQLDRDFARNKVLGPILGSERVTSRQVGDALSLVTRFGDETSLLYPKRDPRHPEQQHQWFVSSGEPDFKPGRPAKSADFNGESVLVGFLKS